MNPDTPKLDAECLVVTLKVTCWAFSLGGEHFTGTITGYRKRGDCHIHEVMHKLSAKQTLALNKKDSARGRSLWRPGELSSRFDTRAQVERRAAAVFRKEFPLAIVLNVGQWAVGDPQRVLAGPPDFKETVNAMVKEWDRLGGYEGNDAACTRLFHRYRKLLGELKDKHTT